jgi:hypothetical protein
VQTLGKLKQGASQYLNIGGFGEISEKLAEKAETATARLRSGAAGAAEFLSDRGGKALGSAKKVLGALADSPLAKKALKVVPFLGIGAGAASAGMELKSGNKISAALDAVGVIPVLGDAVDAVRLGVELGGEVGTWVDKKTGWVDKLGVADAAANAFGGWWDKNVNKRFNL